MEILTSEIIYGPTWYGIAGWVVLVFFLISFVFFLLEDGIEWCGIAALITLVGFVFCLALTFNEEHQTFLNKPSKMIYTIEITDDLKWKEIATNFTVKEKPYPDREIYIIEGDYENVYSNQ